MFFGKLDENEQRRRTMGSLAGVFQRTMRILSGKPLVCSVVEDPSTTHPAWTEQGAGRIDRIVFNLSEIGPLATSNDIVRVTGVGHHERCHVTYTPPIQIGQRNPLGALFATYKEQAYTAFNILEDQRVESMDVAMYPSTRHYYSAIVAGYILQGGEQELSLAWMLVYGRRYLGSEIREALEKIFAAQDKVADIKAIIDAYRQLDIYQYGDQVQAARLVEQLMKIMYEDMPKPPEYSHATMYITAGSGDSEDKQQSMQASTKVRQNKDDRDEMDKDGEGEEGEDEEDGEGSGSKGSGEEDDEWDEDDETDDDGDGKADRDGGGMGSDGSPQGEGGEAKGESESHGPGGRGASRGGDPTDTRKIAKQIAQGLIDEAMQDEVVQAEVRRSREAVKNNEHHDTIGDHRGWLADNRPDAVSAAKQMGRRLERIRADHDPGWDRNQPAGRLNVQRAMHASPLDDVWDVWEEGKTDVVDIETVVCVDVSGSMSNHVRALSDSTWSIKHGHDRIGAPCTVYAFDHCGYLVYKAHDRAMGGQFPNVPATGGTDPHSVVMEAARILSASKRKKKLFVLLTDGIFSGGDRYDYRRGRVVSDGPTVDGVIAEMNGHHVLTAMVYLTGAYDMRGGNIEWHNCVVQRKMASLAEFPSFTDELVRGLMKA